MREIVISLVAAVACKFIRSLRGSVPLSKQLTIFGLERNDPARPIIFTL
jgi:hypothetical protein